MDEFSNNHIIGVNTFTKVFLFTLGIIPNGRYKKHNSWIFGIYVLTFVSAMTGELIGFMGTQEVTYRVLIVSTMFTFVYNFCVRYFSKINENLLVTISENLCKNSAKFSHTATNETESYFQTLFVFSVVYAVFTMITLDMAIIMEYIYAFGNYNNPDLYLFSCSYWYWEVNSLAQYLIINIIEHILCSSEASSYVCLFIFCVCVSENFVAHTRQIRARIEALKTNSDMLVLRLEFGFETDKLNLEDISEDAMMLLRIKWRCAYNNYVDKELKHLILYQQFIYRYVNEFICYLEKMFTAGLCWFLFTAILMTYAITQTKGNFVFAIKITFSVLNFLLSFYLYCYVSEIISHLNESLLDSFYSISWFYQTPESRKLLTILMLQCHKKFKVKAVGMYLVNFNLFALVIRSIYSAINIMLAAQNKLAQ